MSKHRIVAAIACAALVVANPAWAQLRCSAANDQSAFEVGALKSELSVLAVGCSDEDDYNRFVERYRSELVKEDGVVNEWFRHAYGRAAQREYDSYITLLANEQGQLGMHQGSDFCPRNKMVFAEVMAVPSADLLPQYAAAKDLVPAELGSCQVIKASAPEPASRSRRAPAKKK
jgi:hypothetical protein